MSSQDGLLDHANLKGWQAMQCPWSKLHPTCEAVQGYIQLINPNVFAIDISSYKLSGGAGGPAITFAPGVLS